MADFLDKYTSLIFYSVIFKSKIIPIMPNTIHIKAFGMVAEKIGTTGLAMDHSGDSSELLNALLVKFPVLKSVKFTLAVNKKIVNGNQGIPENAEIALLPPFSGG